MAQQLHLATEALGRHRHLCAFFSSQEEQYEFLMPFVREGLEQGERGFHIVDPARVHEHRAQLETSGIPVDTLEREGRLEVRAWQDAYLRSERFDQRAMLSLIEEVLQDGAARGTPLTRLVANMEWALLDKPGVENLVEYETRLNYVLPKYKDPVICTYDISKFSADVLIDVLRTHPVAIVGGLVHENPFFVPPDELLLEIARKRDVARPS
jgi:DcmR-like sensory protein